MSALLLSGWLAGCAGNGANRQARVEGFCHDWRAGGNSAEGVTKCLNYYAQHPSLPPPDLGPMPIPPPQQSYSPRPPSPSLAAGSRSPERVEVALSSSGGGVLTVPAVVNGMLRLGFVVDSGAAEVVIPADVMMTLLRTGTVRDSDVLEKRTSVLADGSEHLLPRFRIRSLKVGSAVLENVPAIVSPAAGEPLLGQSFLRRFRSWSLDNERGLLVLGE
jgi:clan AA aspartic protease (TIGR02281 family)